MQKRNSVSRRDFVKAAALAVGAPTIISARALASADAPAASDRLSIGFIGIGKQGNGAHLGPLSNRAEVEILAVCDVHSGRRERAKKTVESNYAKKDRAAKVDQYVDYHELLARKDIDAVVIAAPDHWHTAIAMDACKAGKDIYCEKPLTLTIHEAKTLLNAVRKTSRVFQTGSQQRSTGPFRQACEYIRNGRIGKVKEVLIGIGGVTSKACDLSTEPTPEGIEWDVWLGQAPERGYNDILCRKESDPGKYPYNPGWRDYREFAGGMLTDWGAHHLDITQWALDMDKSGPTEILPPEKTDEEYGASVIYRGSPVGDNIVVRHVHDVWEGDYTDPKTKETTHKKELNGILFIGENGRIFVSRSMVVSEPDTILKDPIQKSDIELRRSPNNNHHQDWLDCIKSRQLPIADVEIGARSVAVCHLFNLAYWNRRKLTWNAKSWEFPGDAEANSWRDRARRGKYQLPLM